MTITFEGMAFGIVYFSIRSAFSVVKASNCCLKQVNFAHCPFGGPQIDTSGFYNIIFIYLFLMSLNLDIVCNCYFSFTAINPILCLHTCSHTCVYKN